MYIFLIFLKYRFARTIIYFFNKKNLDFNEYMLVLTE